MTRPIIIHPKAEQDMVEGRDWYENHRAGLGAEFLNAINELFERIREVPELHAPIYKLIRRTGMRVFPYVVYYRIVGESIEVIAVQHGSRHPRRWRSRG